MLLHRTNLTMRLAVALALLAAWPAAMAEAADPSCRQQGRARSKVSDQPAKMTFINSSSTFRSVIWLDFKGREKTYAGLNPGQRITIDSFVTHPWLITTGPGDCLRIVYPRPGRQVVHLVDPGKRPNPGEEGHTLHRCPPGTRPVPETDNCVPISRGNRAATQFLGTWTQVESNAGQCETCTIAFDRERGGLRVTSNNGWSARLSPDPGGDDALFAGEGRWQRSVGGAYGGRPFRIEFYLTARRLQMNMTVDLGRNRKSEIRAAYVR